MSENNINRKKIWGSILALSGEQVFKILLGIISNIVIVRYLAPEDLGLLSYVLSFSIIVSHFTTFGTHEPTVELLTQNKENHNLIMGSSCVVKVLGSLLGLFLFTPFIFYSSYDLKIKAYILLLIIFQSFKVFDTIYEFLLTSLNLSKIAAYRAYLSSFLTFLRAVLIYFTHQWDYVIWLVYLEMFLLAVVYIFIYLKEKGSILEWSFTKEKVYTILEMSFPIFILTASTFAIIRTDQIMISYLLSFEENGYYSISSRLIESILFLPITISCVYYPAMIEKKKEEERVAKVGEMYCILFVLALAQVAFLSIFGPYIIPLLFGEKYIPAIEPFMVNIWSLIFIYWNLGRLKAAPTLNTKWAHISVLVTSLALSIILNWILIPKFGLKGAAFTTICAPLISVLTHSVFNFKIREDTLLFLLSFKRINKIISIRSD